MNTPNLLHAAAQLCNGVGLLLTVLVYKRPDSRTFYHNKSELPGIAKRDAKRHRKAVTGFIALGLGFALQIMAQVVRNT